MASHSGHRPADGIQCGVWQRTGRAACTSGACTGGGPCTRSASGACTCAGTGSTRTGGPRTGTRSTRSS